MISLRELLQYPRATVTGPRGENECAVHVSGLLCDGICAHRVQSAFAGIDHVEAVRKGERHGDFVIIHNGAPPDPDTISRALESVIVLKWARRLLHRLRAMLAGEG